ncbi:anthranilate phosphoribosyltransferase TrpD [Psychroflexus torquis ATCC 700755]|uniref:Anthranilate phosphoribosyltransferase n=1 Tax=Psychroflexus torquis (strain ATCC 700755 / CIP 106069 / ACAM 623) TaxID=313595 RepID=K4IFY8_PSYTT|nr:anthranilate phosphoribosyltransferase [Psychroflexus torquis]AFU69304.1 anthranilate phosphoribosyltransferase TrpD [Psychroflexus torquis ATCC 700755]
MKYILNRLIQQEQLSKDEAKEALLQISNGDFSDLQIASFLTVFMMRSISVEELEGFRDALLELCIPVDFQGETLMDLCGTGGDGQNTFNVSTAASFVVAAMDVKVAKHGNYGVSSVSGSSNVLEAMGIKFSNEQGFLDSCMEKANIAILHAPLFHPAMKNVAPIRQSLALKTFFNMLGPMVNPARPDLQLVGVYDLELLRKYQYLYQKTSKTYCILHDLNQYDEISLTAKTKCVTNSKEIFLSAEDFGVLPVSKEEIYGGDTVKAAADIFYQILSGKGTVAQNHVVCANAAAAISTAEPVAISDAFIEAKAILEGGKALEVLNQLKTISQS